MYTGQPIGCIVSVSGWLSTTSFVTMCKYIPLVAYSSDVGIGSSGISNLG